jgi:hypothetical protein
MIALSLLDCRDSIRVGTAVGFPGDDGLFVIVEDAELSAVDTKVVATAQKRSSCEIATRYVR